MKLIVNGEEKYITSQMTVENFLLELGLDPKKVAVERNLEIVPKSEFSSQLLEEEDKLEIVHFIGGGL